MEVTEIKTEVPVDKTRWSYSRLDTYKSCHFKYKLNYVDKLKPKGGNVATDFGTAIHHAEEAIANCIMANKPIDYITIKNKFIVECANVQKKFFIDWSTPNKDSGKTYAEQEIYYLTYGIYRLQNYMKQHPELRIEGAEVSIDYRYKNHRFTGSIDRLLFNTETNSYIIQDVKSWPIIDKHKEDVKVPMQLAIYSLALAEMKNCDVSTITCQYDLPLKDHIYDAGEYGFRDAANKKIDEIFAGIEAEDWTPMPMTFCAWCPYSETNPDADESTKHACPYHSIWDRNTRIHWQAAKSAHEWKGIEDYNQYKATLEIDKNNKNGSEK